MHYQGQALHQSCEELGVDTAKQGVWKQAVYKAHLDGTWLRVNSRGQLKTEGRHGKMRAPSQQEVNIYFVKGKDVAFRNLQSVDSAPGTSAFSRLWIMSGPKCVCLSVCDTEVRSVDRDNKQ